MGVNKEEFIQEFERVSIFDNLDSGRYLLVKETLNRVRNILEDENVILMNKYFDKLTVNSNGTLQLPIDKWSRISDLVLETF